MASASDTSDDDSDDSDDDSSESDNTAAKQNQNTKTAASSSSAPTPPKNCRTEILGADGASSSDMELPALVSAAIQRVAESGSDGEIGRPVHYTSSLLRDFVAKTQMLGSNMAKSPPSTTMPTTATAPTAQTSKTANAALETAPVKKKRGRPRKNDTSVPTPIPAPATMRTSATNATKKSKKNSQSPDSGIITSTPHSPVPNGLHEAERMTAAAAAATSVGTGRVGRPPTITKAAMKQQAPMPKKLDIGRLEKCMYATERVLYPPRRKLAATAVEEVPVDPVWRKIDINKKFRRPSMCGYKSDGGNTICSKVLAAQSGYISDYGNVKTRHLSGYKSDYSCKSRRSGYKSDFSVKAKSCGYRSDCSTRHRRKIRRKRRTKTATSSVTFGNAAKSTVTDLDILQLAGLSLGQSEESSRDSNSKDEILPQTRKRGGDLLESLCERVTQRVSEMDGDSIDSPITRTWQTAGSQMDIIKMVANKPAMIRRRRSSAVSHCSSRCSTISRHPFRRRRRKRLKSRSDLLTEPNATKVNPQIESLVNSFSSQCSIYADKSSARDKDTTTGGVGGKSGATKRVVKKRKGATDNDKEATTSTATSKRRHKKAVQTKSPDDHKLPLKKRHYLLTPGEKGENKSSTAASPTADSEKNKSVDEQTNTSEDAGAAGKAVTPKKRHLLETPNEEQQRPSDANDTNAPTKDSAKETGSEAKGNATSKRVDSVARKKTRLEGVLSKIQPANVAAAAKDTAKAQQKDTAKVQPKESTKAQTKEMAKSQSQSAAQQPTKDTGSTQVITAAPAQIKSNASGRVPIVRTTTHEPIVASPPPGVFVSTIDLELQIPFTSISLPSLSKPDIDLARTGADKKTNEQNCERVVEKLLNRTGAHLLMKRKRKKPNRTGFPTLKKKKRKPTEAAKLTDETVKISMPADHDATTTAATATAATEDDLMPMAEAKEISAATTKSNTSQSKKISCDRVPSEGEPTATFIERNSRPRLSVVSLDRLQGKDAADSPVGSKRLREMSEEKSQSNRKRHKNDRLGALEKEKRDHSSDSEPLINFVQKKNATTAAAVVAKTNDKRVAVVKLELMKTTQDAKRVQKSEKPNASERRGRNVTEKSIEKAKTPPPAPVAEATMADAVPRPRRRESICVGKIDYAKRRGDDSIDFGTRRGNRRKEMSSPSLENAKKKARPLQSKEVPTVQKTEKNVPKFDTSGKLTHAEPKPKPDKSSTSTKTETAEDKSNTTASTKKSAPENSSTAQHRRNEAKRSSDSDTRNVKKRDDDAAKEKIISKTKAKATASDTVPKENTENDKKTDKKEKDSSEQPIESVKSKRGHDKTTGKSDLRSVRKSGTPPAIGAALNGPVEAVSDATITEDVSDAANTDLQNISQFGHEHDPLPIEERTESDEIASFEIGDNRKALSRPKKRYLTAGLFSNYYKENHQSGSKSSTSLSSSSVKPDEMAAAVGSLLPPPTYCERYFRRTEIDFCLPWDLWHAHENGKLPGRNIVHSWNFKKIRTNVYCDVRANPSTDLPQCCCKPETNCGDNCLNRLVYTECSPETCPCRESCQNTKIQRHMIAPGVEKFMTKQKGWGVQTKLPIKKGTYILEYVGEVVTEREFKERMATLYTSDIHHYCLHLDGGLVIDGHRMGSDCRFVNHSCAPNCEMQKWSVNGLSRMALFAMRDIHPSEELTYDYNFSLFNPAEGQPCKCESEQCRGVIGGKSQRVRPIESNKVRNSFTFSRFHSIYTIFSISTAADQRKSIGKTFR